MTKFAADYKCSRRVIFGVVHGRGVYRRHPALAIEIVGSEMMPLPLDPDAAPTAEGSRPGRGERGAG